MGFFRRIEDYLSRTSANTVNFSDAEKQLRLKQLREDCGPFAYYEGGFSYQNADLTASVKWMDIERVIAYKLDRFTYDLICVDVYWAGSSLLITEDDPGRYQFIERLNSALSIAPDWEARVALPPFQTNETVVYQK